MEFTTKLRTGDAALDSVCVKKRQWMLIFSLVLIFQLAVAHPSRRNAVFREKKLAVDQQMLIQGVVSDEYGVTLPGANVMNKKTKMVVHTDAEGKFAIEASEAKTILVITFLGMKKAEVTVTDPNIPLEIVLKNAAENLKEVVVVGYTSVKKENLIGSVQTLTNKQLNTQTVPFVENLLQGKIAGVNVRTSSALGGTAGDILIRGRGTFSGTTDPLWVVDGVTLGGGGDLGDNTANTRYTGYREGQRVNPNDIETITFLKDAASTAMYGSRGANGVIIVTTKRGKLGKPTINYTSQMGLETNDWGKFSLMNGAQLYDYYNSFPNKEAFSSNSWWTPELRNKNFDWQRAGRTIGITNNHNVSFSTGNEKSNLYVSLGAFTQKAPVLTNEYDRYTALLNCSYKMYDWLTVKPQINYTGSKRYEQAGASRGFSYFPWDSPYLPNGSLLPGPPPHPTWVGSNKVNPFNDKVFDYNKTNTNSFSGSLNFDLKLSSSFTFRSINNLSYAEQVAFNYGDPRTVTNERGAGGSIDYNINNTIGTYFNHLLEYTKTWGKHEINAVVGYEWNESAQTSIPAGGTGILPGFIVGPTSGLGGVFKGGKSETATQSYLSNITYSYNDRYLGQLSLRWDGASNFSPEARYGVIFAAGAAWNIHNESFFKSTSIKLLKVRANYGSSGNRPADEFAYMGLYDLEAKYNEKIGAKILQYGQLNLNWETIYTTSLGLDINFKDRFNLTVEVYNKNTDNLLSQDILPGVTGSYSPIWKNVGALYNRGIEAVFDLTLLQNTYWNWSLNGNIAANKNKVTAINSSISEINLSDRLFRVGMDIDTWYLPEWAGVDPQTGQAQWFTINDKKERVKTFDYEDAEFRPAVVGKASPSYFGGFGTDINYKNFDFSAHCAYSVGGLRYVESRQTDDSDGNNTASNQMNLIKGWSRWQKPGDIATHPQAIYNNSTKSNRRSSRYLEPDDYWALDYVQLGYTLNDKSLPISTLRLFVSGQNLVELNRSSKLRMGYYNPRIFTFGINLNL